MMNKFIMNWIFGFYFDETKMKIKFNRLHPFIWFVFLIDLIFGPLIVLLCYEYTWKEYFYELKTIIHGEY